MSSNASIVAVLVVVFAAFPSVLGAACPTTFAECSALCTSQGYYGGTSWSSDSINGVAKYSCKCPRNEPSCDATASPTPSTTTTSPASNSTPTSSTPSTVTLSADLGLQTGNKLTYVSSTAACVDQGASILDAQCTRDCNAGYVVTKTSDTIYRLVSTYIGTGCECYTADIQGTFSKVGASTQLTGTAIYSIRGKSDLSIASYNITRAGDIFTSATARVPGCVYTYSRSASVWTPTITTTTITTTTTSSAGSRSASGMIAVIFTLMFLALTLTVY